MYKNIAFIGSGSVSTALGLYFKEKGFEIQGYVSRSFESACKAAELTKSHPYTSLETLILDSEMVWITTPDDQIEAVAGQIAGLPIGAKNGKLILHASGVHTLSVLETLRQAGYNIAAAHPLLAFGDLHTAVFKLNSVWFAIEGAEATTLLLEDFFKACGNQTFRIAPAKKPLYHAGACVLSNYMVTLLDASYRMFEKAGMAEEDIPKAIAPLIESVIDNLKNKPLNEALTGPIKRGDSYTVRMHLDALQNYMPEMTALYKLLGRHTARMINEHRFNDILD